MQERLCMSEIASNWLANEYAVNIIKRYSYIKHSVNSNGLLYRVNSD